MSIEVRYFPPLGDWNLSPKELFFDSVVAGQKYRIGMRPKDYPFYAYAPIVGGVVQYNQANFIVDSQGGVVCRKLTILGGSGIANFSDAGALATLNVIGDAYITDLGVAKLTSGNITSKQIILMVAEGAGDSYIAGGNALDLVNWRGGDANAGAFILGLDDSAPNNPAKLFIGNYSQNKYLQYDGANLSLYGGSIYSTYISAGVITGADVYANYFGWKRNTHLILLGCLDEGWVKSISPNSTIIPFATNQLAFSLGSSSSVEESYIKAYGWGIILGSTSEAAVQWNYNPSLEFWAKFSIDTSNNESYIAVRMGDTPSNTASYAGWFFQIYSGVLCPCPAAYNPGGPDMTTAIRLTSINAAQWHKYTVKVINTATATYTINWYVDDSLVYTATFTHEWTVTSTTFSLYWTNGAINRTVGGMIAHALFQQSYS